MSEIGTAPTSRAYQPYNPTGLPKNINVGKLGHEKTAFDLAFKARSTAPAKIGPDGIYEYLRQIWTDGVLEHKFNQNLLIDIFQAPVEDGWMDNLKVSHSARITFKKWMNPLSRVRVAKVGYKEGVSCPKQLDLDCVIPPAGPLDDYEQVDVDFSFEYSIRVDECVKTRKLTLGEAEQQYAENVEAVAYRRALDAWQALADQIVESQTPIMIPSFVGKLGQTNYFDAGDADFYETASNVFNYMARVFGRRFNSDFVITIHPDLALDIEVNHSDLLSYDRTGIQQDWLNVDQSMFGQGFDTLPSLPRWRNKTILIAPDDVAMHNGLPDNLNGAGTTTTTMNPWENAAGTKVRMIIASRRSFWTKIVPLMEKTRFPATVENPVESIVEIWMGGNKLIYPEETFMVEFNRPA